MSGTLKLFAPRDPELILMDAVDVSAFKGDVNSDTYEDNLLDTRATLRFFVGTVRSGQESLPNNAPAFLVDTMAFVYGASGSSVCFTPPNGVVCLEVQPQPLAKRGELTVTIRFLRATKTKAQDL